MSKELSVEDKIKLRRYREERLQRNQKIEDGQIKYSRVELFLKEFYQARQLQYTLLEEARELGFLSIITEVTGITIPQIPQDYEDHLYQSRETEKESVEQKLATGWGLYIPAPTLSNIHGIWRTHARIYALWGEYRNGIFADTKAVGVRALNHSEDRLLQTPYQSEGTFRLRQSEQTLKFVQDSLKRNLIELKDKKPSECSFTVNVHHGEASVYVLD